MVATFLKTGDETTRMWGKTETETVEQLMVADTQKHNHKDSIYASHLHYVSHRRTIPTLALQ